MRVLKNSLPEYESFSDSLQYLTKKSGGKYPGSLEKLNYAIDKDPDNSLEKYSFFVQNFLWLYKQIESAANVEQVENILSQSLKRIITIKEVSLFLFDEQNINLLPAGKNTSAQTTELVNNAFKEGILEWLFKKRSIKTIPDLTQNKNTIQKLTIHLLPLLEGKEKKGVLYMLTPANIIIEEKLEQKFIEIIVSVSLQKISMLNQKDEVSSVYKELQTYQTKLSNDFKLSAIGELTTGVAENILSPLQVILSQVDLLKQESKSPDDKIFGIIDNQVKKIDKVITRLIKFANVNDGNSKVQACSLNNLIKEYFAIIASSLKNENYEYVLDLGKNLPSILSNPNYIHQVLTALFQVIRTNDSGGGIFVQTKYQNQNVYLRIGLTKPLKKKGDENNDPNLRLINHLMKKHEGELKIVNNPSDGSLIILRFPLNRKIKQ